MNLTTISISTVAAPVAAIVAAAVTTEQIVSVTQSILLIIAAVGVVAVNIIMARKVDKVDAKLEDVKTKAEVIVGHVNSEKTAAEGRQAALEVEVRLLRQMIEEKKLTAALLAQATAAVPSPAAPSPLPGALPGALPGVPPMGSPERPMEMIVANSENDPAKVVHVEPKPNP